jgi:alkylated DNA repair dioxygenase AlkB
MTFTGKSHAKRRKLSSTSGNIPIDLTQENDHEPICLSDSDVDAPDDSIECLGVSTGKQGGHEKSMSKSINNVLRDTQASSPSLPHKSLPPLLLTTPEQVAKYTPCSLHFNFLPTELADTLFRTMMCDSSKRWEVSKFHMNGKHVQSAHTTGFYMKDKSLNGNYWYMGQKTTDIFEESMYFPPAMLEAKKIIDEFVNQELRKGKRAPLEYDGPWEGNVAAANNYKGASGTVGAHSDQMTYLGPAPTIASISLGVTRNFRLRGVPSLQHPDAPPPRTYDIRLPHNSLCLMRAGCQEHFKHSVPPARSIDLFKLKGRDGKIETFVERINVSKAA